MNPKLINLLTSISYGWTASMKGGAEDAAQREQQFAQQLQGMMTAQFGKQNAITDRLNAVFFKYVENPQGFDPAEMAAMRTQATETNTSEFLAGEKDFQSKAFALGGRDLPSGAMLQAQLLLEGGRAQAESASQREITLADANLKRTNMFNAASILSGNAAMLNPVGYAGVASNTYHNSVQDLIAANQNPMLSGILGGVFGMGSSAITAFCPAEGSLYLMADGSEKLVETLVLGDLLAGIDGEAQTIEEIMAATVDIIAVTTDDGFGTRTSATHAFALPHGGFVVAAKSAGKKVVTAKGVGTVTGVQSAGKAKVFNVITDGSHTYRVDGVWSLGVGDAERHVPMDTWKSIGEALLAKGLLNG